MIFGWFGGITFFFLILAEILGCLIGLGVLIGFPLIRLDIVTKFNFLLTCNIGSFSDAVGGRAGSFLGSGSGWAGSFWKLGNFGRAVSDPGLLPSFSSSE